MNLWQFMMQNRLEVVELTLEHLWLVGISTLIAVVIGVPLGIMITRWPALNRPILGGANERGPTRNHDSQDRKSTRLNSSHVKISYAVFCLKKKKKTL